METEISKRYDSLPSDYITFIESEKETILENGDIYFLLFNKELALEFNEDMEVLEFFPKFLFVGKDELSNGIAYNICNSKLYFVPIEGDEADAIEIAENFADLVLKIENEELRLY